MMRRVLICMCGAIALSSGCSSETSEEPALVRPVRYMKVSVNDGVRQRVFSGVARAGQESRLSFRVAGRLSTVAVKVGDVVKKGKTIAKLDTEDLKLQLQEARAALAQTKAQARNAESAYGRARALYENQNASKQDLDNARAQADSAKAAVASASQQVQLSRRRLDYAALTAPGEGVISSVDVEENENVSAGQPIATLQVGEQIEVNVAVPESLIREIREGDPVRVRFGSLDEIEGTVFEVGVASEGGASFPVTVRLGQGGEQVRAGMAAEVAFDFAAKAGDSLVKVPSSAVGEDREGRFVFLLQPSGDGLGHVKRRAVIVGDLMADGMVIREGVSQGDLVVTAGVSRISDGLQVRIPAQPGEPVDSAASDGTDQ